MFGTKYDYWFNKKVTEIVILNFWAFFFLLLNHERMVLADKLYVPV